MIVLYNITLNFFNEGDSQELCIFNVILYNTESFNRQFCGFDLPDWRIRRITNRLEGSAYFVKRTGKMGADYRRTPNGYLRNWA